MLFEDQAEPEAESQVGFQDQAEPDTLEPLNFELFGKFPSQDAIIELIFNKQFPRCFMLNGKFGIGKAYFFKTLLSTFYAKLGYNFNLTQPGDMQACIDIFYLSSLNQEDLAKDGLKELYHNQINVESIQSLQAFIQKTPQMSDYKFVIIDSVDFMSKSVANSLLKTLEEASYSTFFFLTCHFYKSVIDTIKSRAISFNVAGLQTQDCMNILNAKNEFKDRPFSQPLLEVCNYSPGLYSILANLSGVDKANPTQSINQPEVVKDPILLGFLAHLQACNNLQNLSISAASSFGENCDQMLNLQSKIIEGCNFYLKFNTNPLLLSRQILRLFGAHSKLKIS